MQARKKNHSRVDFVEVVNATHSAGLTLSPTFIPFHPWTKIGFVDLLSMIIELNLIENVSPVQLGIRLLITEGSRILELKDINHSLVILMQKSSVTIGGRPIHIQMNCRSKSIKQYS